MGQPLDNGYLHALDLVGLPVWAYKSGEENPIFQNISAQVQSGSSPETLTFWRTDSEDSPENLSWDDILRTEMHEGQSFRAMQGVARVSRMGASLILVVTVFEGQGKHLEGQHTLALQGKLQSLLVECEELRDAAERLLLILKRVNARPAVSHAMGTDLDQTLKKATTALQAACFGRHQPDDIACLDDLSTMLNEFGNLMHASTEPPSRDHGRQRASSMSGSTNVRYQRLRVAGLSATHGSTSMPQDASPPPSVTGRRMSTLITFPASDDGDWTSGKATAAKAVFDQAVEVTSALEDELQSRAIEMKQVQVQNINLQWQHNKIKAALDKSLVDAAEQKAILDAQLFKATADAVEYKAAFEKKAFDAAEQKSVLDAQLFKAAADAAELKAAFDKGVFDAAEQKAVLDAQLFKATADAAEFKAAFDKGVFDAAEQKADFDAQLFKATADASEFKAAFDKGVEDAAEQKAVLDAQLFKATADAAEFKAAFDKGVFDAAEQKAVLDAQLFKATADAAEFKAAFDKGVFDAAEQKADFDAQLFKATADASEFKAAFDKGVFDAAEQKADFDAQLFKATADASEFKAAFDKGLEDAAEQKAGFDAQLSKANADAVEYKAAFDQSLDLLSQQGELLAKTQADAGALKVRFDHHVTELTEQATQAQIEANLVRATLAHEQEKLAELMDENTKLVKQRELLKAELQVALHSYKPKAAIDSGTPADKILTLLTELLDGTVPSITDIMFVQSAILESMDIYQPVNLGKQLLQGNGMDVDVGQSLLNQLGGDRRAGANTNVTLEDFCSAKRRKQSTCNDNDDLNNRSGSEQPEGYESLEDAMSTMLAENFNFIDGSDLVHANGSGSNLGYSGLLHRKSMRFLNEDSRGLGTFKFSSARLARSGLITTTLIASNQDIPLLEQDASNNEENDDGDASSNDDIFPSFSPLRPPPFEAVQFALKSADSWQFDAFKLADATNNHPLSALGFYCFHQAELIEHFGLRADRLARFLRRVESGYFLNPNPYHNATHASDVLQSMSLILRKGELLPGYADPLTHMACLLAAIVHDYEHVGRTNDFLVVSSHDLAMRYNDRSPLENHHISATLCLLKKPEYNFLCNLSKSEFDRLRKTMIDLVLGTDMKQHFAIVSHFNTVHRLGGHSNGSSMVSHHQRLRASETGTNISHISHMSRISSIQSMNTDVEIMVPLDDTERMLSLQMALKCSDLGHTGALLPVHLKWVACLEEEFFRQGDAERAAGLPISALFDRTKQGISKSQVGFYDVVVIPLFHAFSRVFTNTKPMLTYVMRNYRMWCEQQQQQQQHQRPSNNGSP